MLVVLGGYVFFVGGGDLRLLAWISMGVGGSEGE